MRNTPYSPARGYAYVLVGAALFGVSASVAKVVLTAGIEPARLAALRCTGSALGLLAVLGLTRPAALRIDRRDLPALVALGLSGAALIQWLYFIAIDRLPVGIALLLEFASPLMVAVYTRAVLRELVPRRVWLALGLALTGLALVAQVWRDTGLDPVGVAAAVAAAACLATFYLLGKRTLAQNDPLSVSFWMFVVAAGFWAVVQPWWSFDPAVLTRSASLLGSLAGVSVPVWAAVAWVVVLGTLLPYTLDVAALRHLAPTTTGIVGMLEPVVAGAVAWLWLGQVLTGPQLAGAVLVLTGVGLVQTALSPESPGDDTGLGPGPEPPAGADRAPGPATGGGPPRDGSPRANGRDAGTASGPAPRPVRRPGSRPAPARNGRAPRNGQAPPRPVPRPERGRRAERKARARPTALRA